MQEKYLDYLITVLLIIIVIALVYTASRKVSEDFTELYFNDHTNLPKYTNNSVNFSFAIHNMENKQYEYDVVVSEEVYYNSNNPYMSIDLNNFNVTLENNETRIISQQFSLPQFSSAKIKVAIKNQTQDIHFWTFHANQSYKYETGYGMLDCLKEVQTIPFSEIEIDARGTLANSTWPIMEVWFDGKKIQNITVSSEETSAYFIQLNGTRGMHVLDLAFINDYYNNATKENRNLYIDNIRINEMELDNSTFIIERGVGKDLFDCTNLQKERFLGWNSALRVKININ